MLEVKVNVGWPWHCCLLIFQNTLANTIIIPLVLGRCYLSYRSIVKTHWSLKGLAIQGEASLWVYRLLWPCDEPMGRPDVSVSRCGNTGENGEGIDTTGVQGSILTPTMKNENNNIKYQKHYTMVQVCLSHNEPALRRAGTNKYLILDGWHRFRTLYPVIYNTEGGVWTGVNLEMFKKNWILQNLRIK